MGERQQPFRTDGLLRLPGDDRQAPHMPLLHDLNLLQLGGDALPKQRIAGARGSQAAVDDPGVRLDLSPSQVSLKLRRL
jgi:hypothetical protein